MKHLSLRSLRTFVTVAECGTISAAAVKLGRSQAAISATITEFEAALGVSVFVRKAAKGLVLTAMGEMLSLEARGLLAHADEFETIAGAMGNALEGELSVACFINLAPIIFANLVAEFNRRYPKIRVHMMIGDHEELIQSMRSGASEVALTFDLALPDQFRSVPMATLPPLAILSSEHPFADRTSIDLGSLAHEPLILMDLPHTREYFLSLYYSLHLTPEIKFRSSSFETVRTLVGNGLGYSLLNTVPRSQETYDGTRVVTIPLAGELRPLQIVLVTLRRITQRRIVRTFGDFARSYIKAWRERTNATAFPTIRAIDSE